MPENPHWYTLRKTWTDDAAFVEVVEFIRKYGYKEVWPPGSRNRYTVMDIGGYHYWTMGSPIPKTILINRKPVADVPLQRPAIAQDCLQACPTPKPCPRFQPADTAVWAILQPLLEVEQDVTYLPEAERV